MKTRLVEEHPYDSRFHSGGDRAAEGKCSWHGGTCDDEVVASILTRDAGGDAWHAMCRRALGAFRPGREMGEQSSTVGEGLNVVSFTVPKYPPAKNEALSMMGAGHSHAGRVRRLLEAAGRARDEQAFVPIENGWVALDVVLHAPADRDPWDATNYLGGIADVLEDKSRRGTLDHLGELADVWLYRNDRQIKEVTYRQIASGHAQYVVTVRVVENPEVP
ncbi:hypothetical protein [Actinomadura sp. 9N407]|uniref:hypothetical protein n=1 Tax=Actinomadura sp. 9N407 TaxID=3375154 RepID=UPI0037B6BEE1